MKLIGLISLLIVLLYLAIKKKFFAQEGKFALYFLIFVLIILSLLKIKNKVLCQSDYFNNQPGKIAFCFLIYDDINHDDLWFDFFKNVDKNKYNIYVHYKVNKPLKHFEKYKLNNCIETEWGDISLVRAQLLLYEKALQDKQNKKFITISNSCIPVKNFNEIYNLLMNDNNKNYFNEAPLPSEIYQYLKLNYVDVKKASQWFIINRELTETLVNHKSDTVYFEYVHAPDEIFFLTTILKYKKQSNIEIFNNIPFATTFTNWDSMNYKYRRNDDTNPHNYATISEDELLYILTSKSLFARKFNKNCKVIINNNQEIDIGLYIKQKIFD